MATFLKRFGVIFWAVFAGVLLLHGNTAGATHKESLVPTVVLDYIPPLGSYADLSGHVSNAAPADYRIAVYINVSGWWSKPNFAAPLTTIQPDGSWSTDITTGGSDQQATDLAVFLVPNAYTPPLMAGGAVLPAELYTNSAAFTSANRRPARTIAFAGHTWTVKFSTLPAGPGPNFFSDDPADVWVDPSGSLHLSIVNRGGVWYSSEVICNDPPPMAYGTYSITLGSPADLLDKNVVLGFFTWDGAAPQNNYREIDIEFSRWGEDAGQNAQFVVQPWDAAGNRHRFFLNLAGKDSLHSFDWQANQIQFGSWDSGGLPLQAWTYANPAYLPPSGAGSVRINLWLMNGWAPSNNQNVEAIIKSVQLAEKKLYIPFLAKN